MAIYPIWNPETGEKKVIEMSVHEITQWYQDNKPWTRDWAEGCASVGELGELQDKVIKSHPDWKEVLKKAQKAGASQSKIDI
jgi:hypothetical protein